MNLLWICTSMLLLGSMNGQPIVTTDGHLCKQVYTSGLGPSVLNLPGSIWGKTEAKQELDPCIKSI